MIKLLKFYSPTCEPCKVVGPMVDEFAEDREDVEVISIDATTDDRAEEYAVRGVPAVVAVNEYGDSFARAAGLVAIRELLTKL